MRHWTEFGVRHGPVMSARTHVGQVPELAFLIDPAIEANAAALAEPLRGLTNDGTVRPGLIPLRSTGVPTAPILEAALAFAQQIGPQRLAQMTFPIESPAWRTWFNVHMNFYRHGVMLEDLDRAGRDAFCGLMRATLSARGFHQARDIMRLNGLLGEVTGSVDEFGEWPYFVSFFGTPSAAAPWGWQLDGHHLAVNCVVVGDELVLTPTFMGSEPCHASSGPLAGIRVMDVEQRVGLDLIRSLDAPQRAEAVQYSSIMPDAIPRHLQHFIDGRMQAGAFKDNVTLPYLGVCADAFSDAQRGLLRDTIGTYVGWANDRHAAVRMRDVDAHLDETWFSWMGGTGPTDPFYYRVHSPVVLVEFDHHPGVAFENPEPTHHHIHSIVRTPNGGDYGADLLAQHHERYAHG